MSAIRLLIATTGAVAALAMGGTFAAAITLTDSDSHGDAVSAAAHDCRASGARTAVASAPRNHGQCVRAVASTNAHREGSEGSGDNDAHGDAVSAAAHGAAHSPADAHGDAVSAVAKNHPTH